MQKWDMSYIIKGNRLKRDSDETKESIGMLEKEVLELFFFFFLNWYSLHARLNSHYEAWSYKKRKHKKVKAYRISM